MLYASAAAAFEHYLGGARTDAKKKLPVAAIGSLLRREHRIARVSHDWITALPTTWKDIVVPLFGRFLITAVEFIESRPNVLFAASTGNFVPLLHDLEHLLP